MELLVRWECGSVRNGIDSWSYFDTFASDLSVEACVFNLFEENHF
jgi:hypothetical protein